MATARAGYQKAQVVAGRLHLHGLGVGPHRLARATLYRATERLSSAWHCKVANNVHTSQGCLGTPQSSLEWYPRALITP